jgi:hypothetical protein
MRYHARATATADTLDVVMILLMKIAWQSHQNHQNQPPRIKMGSGIVQALLDKFVAMVTVIGAHSEVAPNPQHRAIPFVPSRDPS